MLGRFIQRWRLRRQLPPAARDWAIGDVAVCLVDGHWVDFDSLDRRAGPGRGQTVRVSQTCAAEGTVWLAFVAFGSRAFPAGHFRKLHRCTADFSEQLRRRSPAPARKPEFVE
jgi:hypothetical protein